MFTPAFLVASLERGIKSAAQAIIGVIGASTTGPFNLFEADAGIYAGAAAGGFLLSFLTSIVSYNVSPGGSPSLAPKAEVDSTFEGS